MRPNAMGFSYFLMDMTTPGIEVRPIRNAIGDSHFCEIFLNDVTVPAENLVGAENAGWQVAQATLGAERGMTMLELAERLGNAGFKRLVHACPVDDPIVADRLAQFDTEITGLRGLCRKVVEDNENGTPGSADASIVKLYYSELLQRLTDFGADIGGLAAHTGVGQADVERVGVWLLGTRFHRLLGVDHPGWSERNPAHHHRGARPGPAAGTEGSLMAHDHQDIHDELRSVASDLLAKERASGGVVDWSLLAQAGWIGLEVHEHLGGAGPPSARWPSSSRKWGAPQAPAATWAGRSSTSVR